MITRNEWRNEQDMTALPWGDAWWASQTLAPITDAEPPAAPEPVVPPAASTSDANALLGPKMLLPGKRRLRTSALATGRPSTCNGGSDSRRRARRGEKRFAGEMRGLFDRQQASILAHVAGRGLGS